MILRSWQQKIIDDYPSIIKQNKRFILKAPTGAGKTILASDIVERFYKDKKILVLCHRLVLLEQLERALSKRHKVRKLSLSESGPAFNEYDILLSTNMRAKEVLEEAIRLADLIIVDEAHRVSPNGAGYKKILEDFESYGKPDAQFMGLTASPERRTGDQRDQLNLAFDAIIDCADIETLIEDPWKVLECEPSQEGCMVEFEDPNFTDANREIIYYVRAIQEPSLTIGAANFACDLDESGKCLKVNFCGDAEGQGEGDCLSESEERAWSSPIFVQYAEN